MLDFLNKYSGNVHSQNGEDFIIREVVRRLGLETGNCVEIGGADGRWMSNTRLLIEQGWHGRFVETDFNLWRKCTENWAHNPNVRSTCSHVDKYNLAAFISDSTDLLSLDTDGSDYELFKCLKVKPKIVVVEIDSSIPPDRAEFNADGGASYRVMVELGVSKGYFLLCHTGNLIFVDNKYRELFSEIEGDPIEDADRYFNRAWLKGAAS